MEIKVGQIYKQKEKNTMAMVTGIKNERIFLGNGVSTSKGTLHNHYILIKDVES